jgi:hypothetical protein
VIQRSVTRNPSALLESEEVWASATEFSSCWNARGLYNPLQFVLRLRPDIHRALNSAPIGLLSPGDLTDEQLSAFSTYFHETIHWWQHIGSVTGLTLSFLYPAQSHLNHDHLLEILAALGPIKPLRAFGQIRTESGNIPSDLNRRINTAVNNWCDIEFYRWLVIEPKSARKIVHDRYFESVGHSYQVAVSAVLWLLSNTVDPNLELFPDPRPWEDEERMLRESKVTGFYYGSPVLLPPLGAREIFEGQARFSQMQYLYFSSGRTLSWEIFETAGMLMGVYTAAFDFFLNFTGLEQPATFDDASIGLFLLLCDICINPVEALFERIERLNRLIEVHDPGVRFLKLCQVIRDDRRFFYSSISNYSREEYINASNELCSRAGIIGPQPLAQRTSSWIQYHTGINKLMKENRAFDFAPENLPVRVFFARFVQFQADKADTPEFFCWPGVWMTTARKNGISPDAALRLFEKHRALFMDKEDGDVYPRMFDNLKESDVLKTFDAFYAWVSIYELTRQWIVSPGDFEYDFAWLTTKYPAEEIKQWASRNFKQAFGIPSTGFKIVGAD